MNLKKKFKDAANKVEDFVLENDRYVYYTVGLVLGAASTIAMMKVQDRGEQRLEELDWEFAEANASLKYGDRRHIVVRERNGKFGAFVINEDQ